MHIKKAIWATVKLWTCQSLEDTPLSKTLKKYVNSVPGLVAVTY